MEDHVYIVGAVCSHTIYVCTHNTYQLYILWVYIVGGLYILWVYIVGDKVMLSTIYTGPVYIVGDLYILWTT